MIPTPPGTGMINLRKFRGMYDLLAEARRSIEQPSSFWYQMFPDDPGFSKAPKFEFPSIRGLELQTIARTGSPTPKVEQTTVKLGSTRFEVKSKMPETEPMTVLDLLRPFEGIQRLVENEIEDCWTRDSVAGNWERKLHVKKILAAAGF